MNDRIRRLAPIACVLAGIAVLALAGGMARARARPQNDPSLLIAGPASPVPPKQTGADVDECTANAGFWAPDDEPGAEGASGQRRLVCKRYA